jgi:hypothetical protein
MRVDYVVVRKDQMCSRAGKPAVLLVQILSIFCDSLPEYTPFCTAYQTPFSPAVASTLVHRLVTS